MDMAEVIVRHLIFNGKLLLGNWRKSNVLAYNVLLILFHLIHFGKCIIYGQIFLTLIPMRGVLVISHKVRFISCHGTFNLGFTRCDHTSIEINLEQSKKQS
jgi:hypothetical protein